MKRRSSLKAIAAPTGGQMRHSREDYSRIILLPILVILIFLVVDAEAQEKTPCGEWDADHVNWVRCEPKPVNDLEFALYATALWAATALDIESTRRTLDTCSTPAGRGTRYSVPTPQGPRCGSLWAALTLAAISHRWDLKRPPCLV